MEKVELERAQKIVFPPNLNMHMKEIEKAHEFKVNWILESLSGSEFGPCVIVKWDLVV